jgi:hypothetical protein
VATINTPKVFISSTLEDLKEFREKAREAILRLGWQPIDCGYWAAGGNPPLSTCLEKVDEADVVIVIVAHRHGWTPTDQTPGEHKSITRLECERAKASSKGIEVIPLFLAEDADWDCQLTEEYLLRKAKPPERKQVADEVARNLGSLEDLKTWLEKIGTHKSFSNQDELATEVLHALTEWGKHHGVKEAVPSNASIRTRYL